MAGVRRRAPAIRRRKLWSIGGCAVLPPGVGQVIRRKWPADMARHVSWRERYPEVSPIGLITRSRILSRNGCLGSCGIFR
jgi:hypothetical protein